jgi:DNA-binding transcriptional MerR regulator
MDPKPSTTKSTSFKRLRSTERPFARSWAAIASLPVSAHRRLWARTAAITVKALRHYERLGLVTATRTSATTGCTWSATLNGCGTSWLLKRVGVSLRQMRSLLDAAPETLITRLAASREAFALERKRLLRTDRAIALVEESIRHAPADKRGLSRLADVIDMERDCTQMRRYFNDDVWESAKRFRRKLAERTVDRPMSRHYGGHS